jgi:hypothetical protein
MGEIANLRRARKAKARQAAEKAADANRTLHGAAKHSRDLAKARSAREKRELEGRRLEKDEENTG